MVAELLSILIKHNGIEGLTVLDRHSSKVQVQSLLPFALTVQYRYIGILVRISESGFK